MYPLTHTASTLNTREKSLLAQKWLSLRPQFSPAGYYRCSPMRSIGSCKQHSSIAYSQGELFGEVAACAKCTGWGREELRRGSCCRWQRNIRVPCGMSLVRHLDRSAEWLKHNAP